MLDERGVSAAICSTPCSGKPIPALLTCAEDEHGLVQARARRNHLSEASSVLERVRFYEHAEVFEKVLAPIHRKNSMWVGQLFQLEKWQPSSGGVGGAANGVGGQSLIPLLANDSN